MTKNIRKQRLLAAFREEESKARRINSTEEERDPILTLETPPNELTTTDQPTAEDLKKEKIALNIREDKLRQEKAKLRDVKLSALEYLETYKRNKLEDLVKKGENVQELDDEVDKLEELLLSQNIEIDEEDFEECYKKHASENPIEETLDKITKLLRPQTPDPLDESTEPLKPQTPKHKEQKTKKIKISAMSSPISKTTNKPNIADKFEANEDGMVVIGPHGTMISKKSLQCINWHLSGAAVTRKILVEVFGRETLAFQSLTGKPSPAFMGIDKPKKNQLDPLKIADIIHMIMENTQLTAKEVRNAITIKCADENKMFRQREKKRQNAALKLKKQ